MTATTLMQGLEPLPFARFAFCRSALLQPSLSAENWETGSLINNHNINV